MEVAGLAFGAFGVMPLAKECLQLASKHIGPSKQDTTELKRRTWKDDDHGNGSQPSLQFLLVHLFVGVLKDDLTVAAVNRGLAEIQECAHIARSIPNSSDDWKHLLLRKAYDNVLENIRTQEHDSVAMKALTFDHGRPGKDKIHGPAYIVSACGGLIVLDETTRTVRLSHHAAREYFGGVEKTCFPNAHYEISAVCAAYMILFGHSERGSWIGTPYIGGVSYKRASYDDAKIAIELLGYDQDYWCEHVHQSDAAALHDKGQELLYQKSTATSLAGIEACSEASPSLVVAALGIDIAVDLKIGLTSDPQTVLSHAVERNIEVIVDDILDKKAHVLEELPVKVTMYSTYHDTSRLDVLEGAVVQGNSRIMEKVFRQAPDFDFKSNEGRYLICKAAYFASLSGLEFFILNGAEANGADTTGRTSLSYVVETLNLLDPNGIRLRPVNIYTRHLKRNSTRNERTFLKQALESAQLLIENGARVDLSDKHGRTALSYAGHSPEYASLCLKRKASVNSQDVIKRTPLSHASQADSGDGSVVEMLLTAQT
ncbi:ankyrin repeat-containing domain protein [Colletotrichum godetiae]|uniref:Ankyrin repeat-containing domain protein n=1 Tax=Colletotrichum godetiae TaxID=1209918 RepID=A0AAJ0AM90_9PEZI|nr:ankyrin repeat-containing domain protein [Colletotrichum godetiae]KAK1676488.1 ankyrin repeat-containing domain protein [Colletotrichum godetiae]